MKPSQTCVELVKKFEGFRDTAYLCPAGVWTIGYGTTENVCQGDMITKQEAQDALMDDLIEASDAIDKLVTVPLTQEQYDALTSFIYNAGRDAFRKSTMLRLLNTGDYEGAAEQFPRWNKAGGRVLAGLARRREAERQVFEL